MPPPIKKRAKRPFPMFLPLKCGVRPHRKNGNRFMKQKNDYAIRKKVGVSSATAATEQARRKFHAPFANGCILL
jgi:hypothetical protein